MSSAQVSRHAAPTGPQDPWDARRESGRTTPGQRVRAYLQLMKLRIVELLLVATVPTMIFDEVDTGIGGAVAHIVGQKLRALGGSRQVLCVTHLPQVASKGHAHYRVSKAPVEGMTQSAVELLDDKARTEELARMLAGEQVTPAARDAARSRVDALLTEEREARAEAARETDAQARARILEETGGDPQALAALIRQEGVDVVHFVPSMLAAFLDEPASALDPIATAKIEELIDELRGRYAIVIVTHNMQQAARCSDFTAYMYLGELMEFGQTDQIFVKPARKETEDYITGRFG